MNDNIIEKRCSVSPENTEIYINIIYHFLKLFLPDVKLLFKNIHHSDFFKCDTNYDFDVEFLPVCSENNIMCSIGFKRQWDNFSVNSNAFKHDIIISTNKLNSNQFVCTIDIDNSYHTILFHEGMHLTNIKKIQIF